MCQQSLDVLESSTAQRCLNTLSCQADDCEITQVCNTPGDINSECLTVSEKILDCLKNGTYLLQKSLYLFPTAVTTRHSSTSIDPFDDFIAGSNASYHTVPSGYRRNLEQIPDKILSDRFITLLNTYWQFRTWDTQVTRSELFYKPESPGNRTPNIPESWMKATESILSHQVPVYRAGVSSNRYHNFTY